MSDSALWDKLYAKVGKLAQRSAKVGVFGETGGEAPAGEGSDLTIVDIAAIHEYGTEDGHIPERRWIRGAFEGDGEKALYDTMVKLATAICNDKIDIDKAFDLLGAWGAARIKKRVADKEIVPDNAESTKIRKNLRAGQSADAATTTLVDTGSMLAAVSWIIE